MSVARFKDIPGKSFGRPTVFQLEVDRETGIVTIREKRRRKAYDLTLSALATIGYERGVKVEIAEKKAERKAARAAAGEATSKPRRKRRKKTS